MESIFFEITIVICFVAIVTVIFRLFKQPTILAFILSGIIIGPIGQLQIQNLHVLHAMGEFGIALLLFILGLEFRLHELKFVGIKALAIGVLQIVLTIIAGVGIGLLCGFSIIASLYIGIVLAFSSTIIIMSLLSDKRDLNSLYGKITLGILLVQDITAIIILIVLSGFSTDVGNYSTVAGAVVLSLFKGLLLFSFIFLVSKTILPFVLRFVSKSLDTLFLFSLAWVFSISALVSSSLIGFPIAIGGLLAGLALANATESLQIAASVRALRDFFITMFFVTLGIEMSFQSLGVVIVPSIIISLFVVVGKPLIVMSLMGIMGFKKRTSFLTSLSMAQISEFSLLIVFLGYSLGHIPTEIVSLVTLVTIFSFIASTYGIVYSNALYGFCKGALSIFERRSASDGLFLSENGLKETKGHIVLIGAHRMGESILDALREQGENLLVVDFNPDIIQKLQKSGAMHVFGDIADHDIQDKVSLLFAKLIISTVPDREDNLLLLSCIKKAKDKPKIIVLGQSIEDAKILYKAGADYVVLPHLMGGMHLAGILKDNYSEKLKKLKAKHLGYL